MFSPIFYFLPILSFVHVCIGLPEKSIWVTKINTASIVDMQKSMFKGSEVYAQIYCRSNAEIVISWIFVQSPCIEMFVGLNAATIMTNFKRNSSIPALTSYKSNEDIFKCQDSSTYFLKGSNNVFGMTTTSASETVSRTNTDRKTLSSNKPGPLTDVWADGAHLLAVSVKCAEPNCDLDVDLHVEMRNADGTYLSAVEFPFLPFNAVLSSLYLCLALLWLILVIHFWHSLMRIQFYIGLVLALGLWEHLTLLAIYGTLQNSGTVSPSAAYFAELIACFKRTLARLLVLIACLGYGVTKPRLGAMWFRRCLAIGSVYFVLVTIEGMTRVYHPRFHTTRFLLATLLPLMCLDAAIMWWIFIYLARTLRETRIRHSAIKHKLYRNFSYVLLTVSLVSVAFMIWSILMFKRHFCIQNWRYLWIDDAFWQTLFLVIMTVIIILWRPTPSNREYAYSLLDVPTVDEIGGDDDEEVLLDQLNGEDTEVSKLHTRSGADAEVSEQRGEASTGKQGTTPHLVMNPIRPTIVERMGIEASSGPGDQPPVWKVD